jgi:hypothetical protein
LSVRGPGMGHIETFGVPGEPFDIGDGPDGWLWFTGKAANPAGGSSRATLSASARGAAPAQSPENEAPGARYRVMRSNSPSVCLSSELFGPFVEVTAIEIRRDGRYAITPEKPL